MLMPSALFRILAVSTFTLACAHSDAASTDTAKKPAPAATTADAAPGSKATDTISARADSGRVMGNASAPVWVIEASDFQCPFCKQWHDTDFQNLVDKYVKTGKIRLAFLNMPLGMHQHAVPAAEAAMCASVQGKFWQMHEALFSSQKTWEDVADPSATFASLAGKTGVNMNGWNKCMKDHLTLPLIQADRERVVAAHVNSTPTFFVGDQIIPGADAKLGPAIDSALAKGGKKPGN
jgi:protein-disulfide isomerase